MLNYCVVQGRLGADPELRETSTGKMVATVNVGCQRAGKDSQTDWMKLVCWEKTADLLCRYFHKGDEILAEGRIQTQSYEDKSGQRRTSTEISVSKINFTSGRKKAQSGEESTEPVKFEELADDGVLPF